MLPSGTVKCRLSLSIVIDVVSLNAFLAWYCTKCFGNTCFKDLSVVSQCIDLSNVGQRPLPVCGDVLCMICIILSMCVWIATDQTKSKQPNHDMSLQWAIRYYICTCTLTCIESLPICNAQFCWQRCHVYTHSTKVSKAHSSRSPSHTSIISAYTLSSARSFRSTILHRMNLVKS